MPGQFYNTNPRSGFLFAAENFFDEFQELLGLKGKRAPSQVSQFTLSNKGIMDRENSKPKVSTSFASQKLYEFLCFVLDELYEGRPI